MADIIVNRRPGSCQACQADVAVGEGFAFKAGRGAWSVTCAAPACLGQLLSPEQVRWLRDQADRNKPVRELRADGTVVIRPKPDSDGLVLLRALPGAWWDSNEYVWRVSLDLGDRPRLLELADKLGLTVAAELRQYEDQIPPAAAAAIERARAAGAYPYQLDGVRALALNAGTAEQHGSWLLGDDMGLGKTMQTLMSLPDDAGSLVIVPASLKHNWAAECKRWRPDLTCEVLPKRTFRFPKIGEVVVTNYEQLPAWVEEKIEEADPKLLEGCKHTVLVVDEAHRAKNPKAKRSKKVRGLTAVCRSTWLLTGTPLLNKPLDLWGVLQSGGMARRVFGGWNKFVTLFGGYRGRWGMEWGSPAPEVPERLRRCMLRRTKDEVLRDLPPKRRTVLVVNDLDRETRKMLDEAWKAHVKATKKADDLPGINMMSEIRARLAASRIEAMISFVSDAEEQDQPLLVFSAHRAPIDVLAEREGWAVITGDTKPEDRQEIVDRFQRGELKGVGLTITAGGVGLTLTRASTALFVDLDWTPGNNNQAEDRMHRIGQTASSVNIIHMVSNHVLDLHVHKLLLTKMEMFESAIDRLMDYEVPATMDVYRIDLGEALEIAERQMQSMHTSQILNLVERRLHKLVESGEDIQELSPEQVDHVRSAWSYMLDRCDGAVDKDGVGFNKPDAVLAHAIMPVLDDERAVKLAHHVLRRYRRQLSELYPNLF